MNINGLHITDRRVVTISKTAHLLDLVEDERKFTEQPKVKRVKKPLHSFLED
jgi:hypothetical protein